MLDKDKLWLVGYINIQGMSRDRAFQRIAEFKNHLRFDESVNVIIIPTKDTDNKVEFYNLQKANPDTIETLIKLKENLEN